MNKAAFLLFVAALAPKVSPTTTFRVGSRLAFTVRGGADKDLNGIISQQVLEIKGNLQGNGSAGEVETEDACAVDPCSVRGGADAPESINSADENVLPASENEAVEEVDESKDDEEDGEGGEETSANDPNTVRGGADVPETDDIDDSVEEKTEKQDVDDDEEGGEGGEDVTVDDPTEVRGGADAPETIDVDDVDEDTVEVNNDGEDGNGGNGAAADDPTAVRGGADVPEEDDQSAINNENDIETAGSEDGDDGDDDEGSSAENPTEVRGGAEVPESEPAEENEVPLADSDAAYEVAEEVDDDNGEGGDGAAAKDPTTVRGGADAPKSIDHNDDEQPPTNGGAAAEDAIDVIVDENDNGGDIAETQATSVRGGAQNAADSKDSLDDGDYDYEDEEIDEGQFELEDEFYEDEDEVSVPDAGETIGVSEIDEKSEALMGGTSAAEVFQVGNPEMETIDETVTIYETVAHQHAIDDDSSAFVDREELADAYDDDEIALDATAFRAGHSEGADRASIDDVPRTDETARMHDYEASQSELGLDATSEERTDESVDATSAVISKEVERILVKECGFRRSELRGMKPQIANVVAEKRLRRPQEGIPDSWYDENRKGLALKTLTKVLAVVIPIALGALAIFGSEHVLKLLERRGKSDLLIGVEVEKPRKEDGELTIPGSEAEEENFEDETLEAPTPATPTKTNRFRRSGGLAEGNWLEKKISEIENRMQRGAKK